MDLIDIYRTFHPKTKEYTFFSSAQRTFSRIDHILGHKSSLGKFKKIEIVSSFFLHHNAIILDINYRKKKLKNTNTSDASTQPSLLVSLLSSQTAFPAFSSSLPNFFHSGRKGRWIGGEQD